jgi:ribA/ribD-fused uncharacterized protein
LVLEARETATHVYFLRGPFSQWHPSQFRAPVAQGGPDFVFNCAEQYMMASKANLFGDTATLAEIMAVQPGDGPFYRVPMQQRLLGRQVRSFIEDVWRDAARRVVYRGNLAKFSQDEELRRLLLATGSKTLVEGSAKDRLWGVGLAWDDAAIENQANWRGSNWLGQVLMQVRDALQQSTAAEIPPS